MNNLWANKYKPDHLEDIIGNKNQIKRIKKWLDIILKEYWYDFFKRSVINELHNYRDEFKHLRSFMINHFYKYHFFFGCYQMLFLLYHR